VTFGPLGGRRFQCIVVSLVFLAPARAWGQSDADQVAAILGQEVMPPNVSAFKVREYLLNRVCSLPHPTTADEWSAQAEGLRRRLLEDVIFHGWPREWVNSPPRFENLGEIEGGPGYRLRKLRYEIVPGFDSAAILYEPVNTHGKVPAILNLNGHVGVAGKAIEYKQKRCINFAKQGILALNLEWLDYGELAQEGNDHWFGAHLNLVGANALGLFFLEMRRGLDYLYNRPDVERNRIGVTGLSGGGWQTLVLGALDTRARVVAPVAGYSSLIAELEVRQYGDLGDLEQNATDFLKEVDYTHLTAMLAPRPTLLIHNAEDDCCYRAPIVKPLNYDAISPFFKLYGKERGFQWHENTDPSTHNYQLDNRLAAYRFFSAQFGLPVIESEIPVGQELKSYDQLVVNLPKDNLTILGLARRMAAAFTREEIPSEQGARARWATVQRKRLETVVRYRPLEIARVWTVANSKDKGLESKSYIFPMVDAESGQAKEERGGDLPAVGVWVKSITTRSNATATIVLNDQGRKAASGDVSERVNHDEQVLAFDPLFIGDAWTNKSAWHENDPTPLANVFEGLGFRPLGIEAAQLIRTARWLQGLAGDSQVRLEATGMRSQVIAEVAAALAPGLFSEVVVHEGMPSLGYLLTAPVTFQDAPDLFCLDLYQEFDLDRLAALAEPAKVAVLQHVKPRRTAKSE